MSRLMQIDAQIAALKAEKKKLRPAMFKPGISSRSYRPEGRGQRDPRRQDAAYLSWLHQDIPCVACTIEGPAPIRGSANPIEAAHLKFAEAKAGWREGGLGPRIHDARCIPLCAWHHRLTPNSCDIGGQRKFCDRLGIDAPALCAALHAAFTQGRSGAAVVRAAKSFGEAR